MMTPDISTSSSGAPSDTVSLLRALAAATDWQACADILRSALPRLLPTARLDIYLLDSENSATLCFASSDTPIGAPHNSHDSPAPNNSRLEHHPGAAITTIQLVGAGVPCGWLVLAAHRGPLSSAASALAEMVAPVIALRLSYDQAGAALASSRKQVAMFEEQRTINDTLRLRAMLAVGTAHDIGNIFTTVIGHSQILEQDVPEHFQPDVQLILRAAQDGRELLRRLQTVKHQRDAATHSPIQSVIQETIDLTQPIWQRHSHIAIELECQQHMTVQLSDTHLREVLVNLILNAITAMPSGGTISIKATAEGAYAKIAVADTGQGIAREHHSAIFQPLTSSHTHGSGLGLSVSRALIETQGGTLTVESAPNQGATFTIVLPLA